MCVSILMENWDKEKGEWFALRLFRMTSDASARCLAASQPVSVRPPLLTGITSHCNAAHRDTPIQYSDSDSPHLFACIASALFFLLYFYYSVYQSWLFWLPLKLASFLVAWSALICLPITSRPSSSLTALIAVSSSNVLLRQQENVNFVCYLFKRLVNTSRLDQTRNMIWYAIWYHVDKQQSEIHRIASHFTVKCWVAQHSTVQCRLLTDEVNVSESFLPSRISVDG